MTAQIYGGAIATLDLDVVATARDMVCIAQERAGLAPWLAWIPAAHATPL